MFAILGLKSFQTGKENWPFIQNGENGGLPKSRSVIDHGAIFSNASKQGREVSSDVGPTLSHNHVVIDHEFCDQSRGC